MARHHQKHMVAAVADYDSGNWDSRYTGPATSSLPLGFVPQGPDVNPMCLPIDTSHHASLLARIETILGNPTEYRELLAQQGELAQSLLDLLQTLYDYPGVLPKLRSKILHAIIRLSDKSGLYPNCLALDNVTKVGDHPVAAGGFGEIWKGLIGGQMACLKVVKIYGDSDVQKLLKEFLKEAILWRQFNHPNVLPFLGLYFLDLSKQRICLISPWMEMGNLRQYLDKHGEDPIDYFALAFDIAYGLSYLHEKKVVHGDLKGDNILITNFGRAAIADFGLARKVSESDTLRLTSLSTSHHVKGSTRWLAPECLLENGVHTYHSDIYAFGCVCYEVFTGLIPFYEFPREISVVIHLNEGRRPSRPANSRLNDNMWGIMQECWRQEPDSRPPTNTLSGRIVSAANRKTINLGSNWDDSLPSLLRRNIRYPEICPSGSLVDAFLFGPRYQSTNPEQTHSLETERPASIIPTKRDLFADSRNTINGLMAAPPFPSGKPPSPEYLAQPLSKNPLALSDMLPREQLYGPGKDGALPETPWTWNPRDLNNESTDEDDDFDSDFELDSPSPTFRGLSHTQVRKHPSEGMIPPTHQSLHTLPSRYASEGLAHPIPVTAQQQAEQQHQPMRVTFSPRIVRTPDHYRHGSPGVGGSLSRSSTMPSIESQLNGGMEQLSISTTNTSPTDSYLLNPGPISFLPSPPRLHLDSMFGLIKKASDN
ncbi:kinase-like protein [Dendrothele bispora CBS 962.96]|uniref:Kinase-like protein n=1 Tax=Dendrothele bispora (strain CBS 962.96) TaxID=1314807 RepID=A0A4S8L9V9_DENBC|nr:kinase-like protein [Dendrothele bispora CBS 962.96]